MAITMKYYNEGKNTLNGHSIVWHTKKIETFSKMYVNIYLIRTVKNHLRLFKKKINKRRN